MKYNYSLKHIKQLRQIINLKEMSAPESFRRCNSKRLQRIYNGIGPEKWSSRFRSLITWAVNGLESPALIHDYEYSLKDKSYWNFTKANFRLIYNAFCDRRGRMGIVAGILCQLFGYRGYRE